VVQPDLLLVGAPIVAVREGKVKKSVAQPDLLLVKPWSNPGLCFCDEWTRFFVMTACICYTE